MTIGYSEQTLAANGFRGIANYRIPALAVAPNGDLLCAFDERPLHGDSPAPNSIVQRRSTDGGLTWGEVTDIHRGDVTGDPATQTGYSDPSYIVDQEAGLIFNFHVYSKDRGVFDSGYGSDDADRSIISAEVSVSADDGRTWEHRLITDVVKTPDCRAVFATSGAGIQVRRGRYAGRLVQQYVGVFRAPGGTGAEDDPVHVSAFSVFSDDHGATWTAGAPVGTAMDENKVVELSDGTLMMNSRMHDCEGGRWICRSSDGGATWTEPVADMSLTDPGNNAHIVRAHPDAEPGTAESRVLLFSNADHAPQERRNGTVRISFDDGATWPVSRVFQPGDCSYSVIIPTGEDRYALAYEGVDNEIRVATIESRWLFAD